MVSHAFRNGEPIESALLSERGFVYGDGVFETLRCIKAKAPLWSYHSARLKRASVKLSLSIDIDNIFNQLNTALKLFDCDDVIAKIMVSRSAESRGSYALKSLGCNIYIQLRPFEVKPYAQKGVSLVSVADPLASRPAVSGLKLISRLDYILPTVGMALTPMEEALFYDDSAGVVETMHHNIFMSTGDGFITPALNACGVAGTFRHYLLSGPLKAKVEEARISSDTLDRASSVFICNAVDGIVPVISIDKKPFFVSPDLEALKNKANAIFS